jgi:hypothetical protein
MCMSVANYLSHKCVKSYVQIVCILCYTKIINVQI